MKYIQINAWYTKHLFSKNNVTVLKIFLFALLSQLISACGNPSGPASATAPAETVGEKQVPTSVKLTAAQYRVAGIELGQVAMKNLSNIIEVNGLLDVPPQNIVSISAPLGGFLKSTYLLPGTPVRKGEAIAIMEHPDYIQLQQDYLDTKSRLALAALELARQKALNLEKVNSAKVFQQATTDYQLLENRRQALAEKLSLIGIDSVKLKSGDISSSVSLRSPINGYVKTVNVNVGKFVNPADVIFELINTSHMHLALSVFEKDISLVHQGQQVTFSLPNEPGKTRMGKIHLVGKVINPDKTVPVHVHLPKDDPALLVGMYVNARIETGTRSVPALPQAAVVQSDGLSYVFAFKGTIEENGGQSSEFEMILVKPGVSENGFTQVALPEGFSSNATQLVIKGSYALLSAIKNTEE